MGFVDKWPSKMHGQWFSQSRIGQTYTFIRVKISISFWGLPLPVSTSLEKLIGKGLTSLINREDVTSQVLKAHQIVLLVCVPLIV